MLTGINLDVDEGSTCVILGGSGSGKTVLMKHMIGLLKPDQGQVIVDGEDIVPLDARELERVRRKFGMVFQGAALFDSMTVYENVRFPLREHTEPVRGRDRGEMVREKLEIVGLRERGGASTRPSSRAACASGWAWPGPSCSTRRSSSTTSPPPGWTPSPPTTWTR